MISRREFLGRFKHAAVLGALGLGFIWASGSVQAGFWDYYEAYAAQAIRKGEKLVWRDAARTDRAAEASSAGRPYVNPNKCAFCRERDGQLYLGYYCWAPCTRFCPVRPRAILIVPQPARAKLRIRPQVYTWRFHAPPEILDQFRAGDQLGYPKINYSLCIRCRRCFMVCGYHAVEWIESGEIIPESATQLMGSLAGEWEGSG